MVNTIFKKCSWFNTDTGLLILRIGVGLIFILAGWEKVSNLSGTVSAFGAMGFAPFWAYLVAFVEFIGGIAVILGIYTRIAAALLAAVMVVAIYTVHKNPSMVMLPVSLLFNSIALFFAGNGKYSLMSKVCGCGTCHLCGESEVTPKV